MLVPPTTAQPIGGGDINFFFGGGEEGRENPVEILAKQLTH